MADLLARGRPTASASLRAQYGTEMGKKQLNALLNILLSPGKCFNEETKEWCLWLISGGESPEVFLDKLRVYDSSQACGLVWHKNFVAYRCRDCGTSPCMSICADCFHGGDHQGHDYNMFRSQAGGACDCGDENVMKKEG